MQIRLFSLIFLCAGAWPSSFEYRVPIEETVSSKGKKYITEETIKFYMTRIVAPTFEVMYQNYQIAVALIGTAVISAAVAYTLVPLVCFYS
ncbi:hypothetical protein AGMMS49949_04000 [Alphaproteobacteria bacterium]|nr:hypothetical protein AGMMS49949_04000 [Alphaproteobacteria bacterium]GHS96669.1 hypothetical protein AGMMS50296_3060 [Alphaproteobacteria bacterium]